MIAGSGGRGVNGIGDDRERLRERARLIKLGERRRLTGERSRFANAWMLERRGVAGLGRGGGDDSLVAIACENWRWNEEGFTGRTLNHRMDGEADMTRRGKARMNVYETSQPPETWRLSGP